MTLQQPRLPSTVGQGRAPELAYRPSITTSLDPLTVRALTRRAPHREPRLDGRGVVVPHDIGARILPPTRALLDRIETKHRLAEAEVGRILLASGLLAGHPPRERLALALFANGSMLAYGASSTIVAALESEFARMSAAITRTRSSPSHRADRPEHGPRDSTLLRVKLDETLHRRLRLLVDVFISFRRDGEVPEEGDDASKLRLVQYLAARKPIEVARERSPIAEVVRWALAEAESDVDELLAAYMRGRAVIWRRIDRAIDAMRTGARDELDAALEHVR